MRETEVMDGARSRSTWNARPILIYGRVVQYKRHWHIHFAKLCSLPTARGGPGLEIESPGNHRAGDGYAYYRDCPILELMNLADLNAMRWIDENNHHILEDVEKANIDRNHEPISSHRVAIVAMRSRASTRGFVCGVVYCVAPFSGETLTRRAHTTESNGDRHQDRVFPIIPFAARYWYDVCFTMPFPSPHDVSISTCSLNILSGSFEYSDTL